MSRGMPSMTALLGLLAVAGFQNRDKIKEMLGGMTKSASGVPGVGSPDTSGGMMGKLGGLLGGASTGSVLSGGLGELIERFKQNGHGTAADSWVSKGPNLPVAPEQLQQAIGPETLDTLSQQTGLSREELLSRLTRELPAAVDKLTPDGRLPSEHEAAKLLARGCGLRIHRRCPFRLRSAARRGAIGRLSLATAMAALAYR